jgi:heptosyltransferase-2
VYGTKDFIADMIRHHPCVDEIVALRKGEGVLAYTRRLKATGFDACLDLHDKTRSRLIHLLTPGRRFVSWPNRTGYQAMAIALGLRGYRAPARTSDLFHTATERLVGRDLPRGRLRYYPGPDDPARASELLSAAGVDLARPIIGIAPGANWNTKRWPAAYFHELIGWIVAAGYQVALNGGPGEKGLSAQVRGDHMTGVFDFTGASLAMMGGIIGHCTAFIGNDSGPMHMSRAQGVPTLAIFGSTDPDMFEYGEHVLAYKNDLACSPCSFYGRKACPKGHFRCMRDLNPGLVWELLQPLLDGRRRPYLHA